MSTEAFYIAYSTADQVVGLLAWPLDGDPAKTLGLIAHPGPLVGMSLSHDSCKLVTAGAADGSVMVWQVQPAVPHISYMQTYNAYIKQVTLRAP